MKIKPEEKIKLKNNFFCSVRSANEEDAQNLLNFLKIIVQDGEGMVLEPADGQKTLEEEVAWIKRLSENPNEIVLVAESNSTIIGIIDVNAGKRRRLAHTCTFGISVHPEWRGRGVGTIMLTQLFKWFHSRDQLEVIYLNVLGSNTRAVELYKKFGFQEDGRKFNGIRNGENSYDDDVQMSFFKKIRT